VLYNLSPVPANAPKPGSRWTHYKKQCVARVLGVGYHTESGERLVTYLEESSGVYFSRPLMGWGDLVNGVPRFVPVLASVPCPECQQVPHGKGGEHPCPKCGIPRLHDDAAPESEACDNPTVVEALQAAEAALVDLGSCADPRCTLPQCTHALVKVRSVLAGYPKHTATEEKNYEHG